MKSNIIQLFEGYRSSWLPSGGKSCGSHGAARRTLLVLALVGTFTSLSCTAAELMTREESGVVLGMGRCSYVSAMTGSVCDPELADTPCQTELLSAYNHKGCDPVGLRCKEENAHSKKITSGPAPKHDECKPNNVPTSCCNLVTGYCVRYDEKICSTNVVNTEEVDTCYRPINIVRCEEEPFRAAQQSGLRSVAQAGCP